MAEINLTFGTAKKVHQMAQYAIAFDLDTQLMKADGVTDSERTTIYQQEIPEALRRCGFTAHPQGSLYHTEAEQNPINAIMQLQNSLRTGAPKFCRYVKSVHVFRMEEWSDVTELIVNRKPNPKLSIEDIVVPSDIFTGATHS